MAIFIIEHFESRLWKWCFAEYEHISKIIGKNNVWFTNCYEKKLEKLGIVKKELVAELNLKNACLLDPKAHKELTPDEKFDYFIFGGILGNEPAEGRTQKLSEQLNCEKRSLGNKQMSTDTAVLVTKLISEGKKLSEIKFIDDPEIETAENESIILPYRYIEKKGAPVIYPGLFPILRKSF